VDPKSRIDIRGAILAGLPLCSASRADLPAFGQRYRLTSRVRVLEGIEVHGIARPGESLPGAAVEPNLEEAYLAEIDRGAAEVS
jgi:hypothetical protein